MKDMLTKNDLKQIGELLDTKLDTKLDEKLDTRLGEVLEAVNKGFSGVQEQIHGVSQDVAGLKQDVAGLKQSVDGLDRRVTKIEATMVTKSYLDDKLAPINGKINSLVDVLHRNGTISDDQRRIVHA